MDGVLVVDKPPGLTSHDVVAAARRALRERRIGHTGTLDPMATGVLALACGRATRLVRFLTASDKDYDASIRFGIATDTYDATGTETSRSSIRPAREEVLRAIASLTGEYLQMPPVYSAKRVGGRRAYEMARREEPVALTPARVTVTRAELVDFDGETAQVALTCSAGFYVRSFAHRLGELANSAACLAALRRTRSGEFRLSDAVSLADLAGAAPVLDRIVPLERLLGGFPAVTVTPEEHRRISHGQDVRRPMGSEAAGPEAERWVRLIDGSGRLLALATPRPDGDSLHPVVVLI